MLWIYLAALEATPLDSKTTSEPLLTVKQTDMLKPCFFPECQMESFQPHQSAQMLLGWMDMYSGIKWTSSLPGSHARTLALQARVQDWKDSVQDFFMKSCAWPKKSSPLSYSLKTSQQSEHGDWTKLSKNLPKQGMTVDGLCFPLQTLVPRKSVKGGFYWLTPRAAVIEESYQTYLKRMKASPNPKNNTKTRPGNLSQQLGGPANPTWVEWLMGVTQRVDRLKRLGNAVVPQQAKTAFEILMGIK
jgi:hypothetical protein